MRANRDCALIDAAQVIQLITGDVTTGFWRNAHGTQVGIPETSPYAPIKEHVEAMMRGETNPPGGMQREKWAKRVVNDLLKDYPARYIRRGFLATISPWFSWLAPAWLVDYGFKSTAQVGKLAALQ